MDASSWTIRPYQPGDETALVTLFARAFKKPITREYWLWKLRGSGQPFQNVWLAVEGDRIIFQYAGIPVRFLTRGGVRWGVQSVDTMADPDYRLRGLFMAVARHAFEYWRERGAAFVYGLPNEQSRPGFEKLGLKSVFPVRWRRYPISPFSIWSRRLGLGAPISMLDALWFAARLKRKLPHGLDLVDAADADDRFDRIWARNAHDGVTSIVRDTAWVRWRYQNAPASDYRLLIANDDRGPAGYAAYRVHDRTGFITEIFAGELKVRLALLYGAISRLRSAGAQSVHTLSVPGGTYDELCDRLGFLIGENFHFAVCPLASDSSVSDIADPRSWDLSGGDFDVV